MSFQSERATRSVINAFQSTKKMDRARVRARPVQKEPYRMQTSTYLFRG
jgi:hypothetical protein